MKVGEDDILPVRCLNDEYKYVFQIPREIDNYESEELIYKNNKKVYNLKCQCN